MCMVVVSIVMHKRSFDFSQSNKKEPPIIKAALKNWQIILRVAAVCRENIGYVNSVKLREVNVFSKLEGV